MQRTLADVLTSCYVPPPNVHGFVPGRSHISGAVRHQRQDWVLRVDIKDFFPSINFGRVRGMFMAFPFDYPPSVATLLAQICCHGNQLPQGAPSSPIVSNFICRRLDTDLARLARGERCYYTRYADDICFSTDRLSFPSSLATLNLPEPPVLGMPLQEAFASNGFAVNVEKTKLMRRTQRQQVTGLVVNDRLNVSRDYVRSLRNLLYIWERHGEDSAKASFARQHQPNRPPEKQPPRFRRIVQGRIQYVGSVKGWTHPVYVDLARSLQRVDDTFAPRTLLRLATPQPVKLYAEGKTDLLHLLAAKQDFDARGEFTNLLLKLPDDADSNGDAELLKKCIGLAMTWQTIPCVCVFDRDNSRILTKAVGPAGTSKDYGKGVAAVAIVPPSWRDPTSELCIEMLYTDEDLRRTDEDGRRLYLRDEFNLGNGHHKTEAVHLSSTKSTVLVRDDVFTLDGGRSVALSKADFAAKIRNREVGFESVGFSGFRETFELIEEAAARSAKPR